MTDNLEARLGRILNSAMPLVQTEQIAREFGKNPADYKILKPYADMIVPALTGNAETDEAMKKAAYDDLVKASPANIVRGMDTRVKDLEGKVTETVSSTIGQLIGELPEDYLVTIAMAVSGKEAQMEAATEALKKGEVDKARKMYAETAGKYDKAWGHFLKDIASPEFIKNFAPVFFQYEIQNFQRQFYTEGDQEPRLDIGKMRSYIGQTILTAKDEKAKNKLYLAAGRAIGKYQLMAMQQRAAEEQRAAA